MFPKTRLIRGAGVSNDDLDINNSIFLHMTDGIIAFDRDGKIVLINPAAQKMMNVLPEHKDFDDIFGKLKPEEYASYAPIGGTPAFKKAVVKSSPPSFVTLRRLDASFIIGSLKYFMRLFV